MRTARQPTRLRCEVQRLNPESLANILTATSATHDAMHLMTAMLDNVSAAHDTFTI